MHRQVFAFRTSISRWSRGVHGAGGAASADASSYSLLALATESTFPPGLLEDPDYSVPATKTCHIAAIVRTCWACENCGMENSRRGFLRYIPAVAALPASWTAFSDALYAASSGPNSNDENYWSLVKRQFPLEEGLLYLNAAN